MHPHPTVDGTQVQTASSRVSAPWRPVKADGTDSLQKAGTQLRVRCGCGWAGPQGLQTNRRHRLCTPVCSPELSWGIHVRYIGYGAGTRESDRRSDYRLTGTILEGFCGAWIVCASAKQRLTNARLTGWTGKRWIAQHSWTPIDPTAEQRLHKINETAPVHASMGCTIFALHRVTGECKCIVCS